MNLLSLRLLDSDISYKWIHTCVFWDCLLSLGTRVRFIPVVVRISTAFFLMVKMVHCADVAH